MSNFETQEHIRQTAIRLSNSGHRKNALVVLRSALRRDPDWKTGYEMLAGYAAPRPGDEDLAILHHGCERIPDSLELRVRLANFLRLTAPEDALELLHTYVQRHPADRNGRYYSALFLADLGFPEEAVAEFEPCVLDDPNSILDHGHLAGFLTRANQLDRALAEYRLLTILDPADALNYDFLGSIARQLDNDDMAIDAFTEAVRLDKDVHFAWAALAELLESGGRHQEALAAYSEVIRITDDLGFPEGRLYFEAACDAVERLS